VAGSPYFVASGFSATDLYVVKFAVWLDDDWRRERLPKIDALTSAVLARPALAEVWARHVR
jgi:glutathione S-transferase